MHGRAVAVTSSAWDRFSSPGGLIRRQTMCSCSYPASNCSFSWGWRTVSEFPVFFSEWQLWIHPCLSLSSLFLSRRINESRGICVCGSPSAKRKHMLYQVRSNLISIVFFFFKYKWTFLELGLRIRHGAQCWRPAAVTSPKNLDKSRWRASCVMGENLDVNSRERLCMVGMQGARWEIKGSLKTWFYCQNSEHHSVENYFLINF